MHAGTQSIEKFLASVIGSLSKFLFRALVGLTWLTCYTSVSGSAWKMERHCTNVVLSNLLWASLSDFNDNLGRSVFMSHFEVRHVYLRTLLRNVSRKVPYLCVSHLRTAFGVCSVFNGFVCSVFLLSVVCSLFLPLANKLG